MSMIGAAVIGYGGMGSRHAQMMKNVPGLQVVGAWDIDPAKQEKIRADGLTAYPSMQALCEDERVQLAVVATPNHLHKEMSIELLQSQKHVVCEKPVTLDAAELEEIIRVQQETGKLFTVHQNRRWDEDFLAVRQLLADNRLGAVYNVESRVTGSRGVPHDWRRDKACGGGMLMDWGVHLLDQMLCLLPGKVQSVFCRLSYVTQAPVDDGFLILLTFEDGTTAELEASTWKFLNLPRWYVNGQRGSAAIERWHEDGHMALLKPDAPTSDAKPVVTAAGITKTMAPREDDSVETMPFPLVYAAPGAFYQNVVRCIRGEETQAVQLSQVKRVMRLIEAAKRSALLGQPVSFEGKGKE